VDSDNRKSRSPGCGCAVGGHDAKTVWGLLLIVLGLLTFWRFVAAEASIAYRVVPKGQTRAANLAPFDLPLSNIKVHGRWRAFRTQVALYASEGRSRAPGAWRKSSSSGVLAYVSIHPIVVELIALTQDHA
jgi:MYXO-CTERM domain-containing protein